MFRILLATVLFALGMGTARAADLPDIDAVQVEVERIGADAGEAILVAGRDEQASGTARTVVERLQSEDFVFGELSDEAPELSDLMDARGYGCVAAIGTLLPKGWRVISVGSCDSTALLDKREGTGRKFMRYASSGALIAVGILGGVIGLTFTGLGIGAFIVGLSGGGYATTNVVIGIIAMAIGIPVTIVSIVLIAAGVRLARGKKKSKVAPTAWLAPDGGGFGLTARW
jgi:hypothetical protein